MLSRMKTVYVMPVWIAVKHVARNVRTSPIQPHRAGSWNSLSLRALSELPPRLTASRRRLLESRRGGASRRGPAVSAGVCGQRGGPAAPRKRRGRGANRYGAAVDAGSDRTGLARGGVLARARLRRLLGCRCRSTPPALPAVSSGSRLNERDRRSTRRCYTSLIGRRVSPLTVDFHDHSSMNARRNRT